MAKLGRFDLMLLIKVKISTIAYCRNQLGYNIVCLIAPIASADGVQADVALVL